MEIKVIKAEKEWHRDSYEIKIEEHEYQEILDETLAEFGVAVEDITIVDYSNGEHKIKDKNGILVAVVGIGYGMVNTDRIGFHDLSGKDKKEVAETALEFALTETEHRIYGRFYRVEFQRTDEFVCLLRRENGGTADICYDMRAVELSDWYKFKEDEIKAIDERYLEFMVKA